MSSWLLALKCAVDRAFHWLLFGPPRADLASRFVAPAADGRAAMVQRAPLTNVNEQDALARRAEFERRWSAALVDRKLADLVTIDGALLHNGVQRKWHRAPEPVVETPAVERPRGAVVYLLRAPRQPLIARRGAAS